MPLWTFLIVLLTFSWTSEARPCARRPSSAGSFPMRSMSLSPTRRILRVRDRLQSTDPVPLRSRSRSRSRPRLLRRLVLERLGRRLLDALADAVEVLLDLARLVEAAELDEEVAITLEKLIVLSSS